MATKYSIGDIEVAFKPANRDFSKRWKGFGPGKEVLPRGWRKEPGRRALDSDLIFERDVPVILRDGCKIYMDVFRPPSSDSTPVAAIVAWSPYGKQGNGRFCYNHSWPVWDRPKFPLTGFQSLDRVPWRAGIPRDWTSDLEKFEAPDPAEWCPRGYAIVNIDVRGTFDSEGDQLAQGTQVSI